MKSETRTVEGRLFNDQKSNSVGNFKETTCYTLNTDALLG